MEIAPGIHRVGSNSIVNGYLVEEGGEVTIVDAGVSGLWSRLPAELAAMGRTLDDVRAIVLTHGHTDHIGFAERARRERGWPVSVHEVDAALARGEVKNPAKGGGPRSSGRSSPSCGGRPGTALSGAAARRGRHVTATARRSTCRARRG